MKKPVQIGEAYMKFPTSKSKHRSKYAKFLCECGKEFETMTKSVTSGDTNSCGCYKVRKIKSRNTKHGMTGTRLHNIWSSMIKRTTVVDGVGNANYGARGISVCDEWKNDFMSFYAWANSNGYSDGLTIDRIDNDGDYEPSNCRWTTRVIQSCNTRRIRANNTSGHRGVSFNKEKNRWVVQISVNKNRKTIGYFNSLDDASNAYDKYVTENNLEHTTNKERRIK